MIDVRHDGYHVAYKVLVRHVGAFYIVIVIVIVL